MSLASHMTCQYTNIYSLKNIHIYIYRVKENTLNPSDPSYLKWYIAKDNNGHIFDNLVTGGFTSFQASKERMQVSLRPRLGFKGLFLYTVGILFNV